ncbi:MAG: helix-turn-helix transcriptional regulator [Bacteroidota bacterium]
MKLDRLLALTLFLLNRRRVSAQELAEHFEVSPRTIYRDIEALNQAGIPIVSFQGTRGGFEIMENFRLDRQVLTADEMYAVSSTLKGVVRGLGDRRADLLAEKFDALIPRQEREGLRRRRRLVIDLKPWVQSGSQRRKLDLLSEAVECNKLVSFRYTNFNGISTVRTVEPMVLILKGSVWYLYGYCRLREDFRVFRLSRLRDLELCGETFTRREDHLDEIPWDYEWEAGAPAVEMVLRFQARARVRAEDYFDADQILVREDGALEVRVNYPREDWVYGLILAFGEDVEVVAPEDVRREVAARARRIWEIYAKDSP